MKRSGTETESEMEIPIESQQMFVFPLCIPRLSLYERQEESHLL